MLHNRPNKLCKKAKVGGGKKQQQDEGFSQKQADGRMPWGWQGDEASGRPWSALIPRFVFEGPYIRCSPVLNPFIHPSLSSTFFPLCILSEQILFSPRPPWGTGVLTSTHPERKARDEERRKKKREKEITKPTCLTEGHRTVRRPEKRMKGQREPGPGRKSEQRWVGTDNQTQPTKMKKGLVKTERWSLLQRENDYKRM